MSVSRFTSASAACSKLAKRPMATEHSIAIPTVPLWRFFSVQIGVLSISAFILSASLDAPPPPAVSAFTLKPVSRRSSR